MFAFLIHRRLRLFTHELNRSVAMLPRGSCCFFSQLANCCTLTIKTAVAGDFFKQKVQPIFVAKCYACHGEKVQKSAYRLDAREIAMAGGEFGEPAIVAGKSADSPLLLYVSPESTEKSTEIRMPPADSQFEALTAEEIQVLRDVDRRRSLLAGFGERETE